MEPQGRRMVLAGNGHHGDSSDDERDRENVIHIGNAYQAVCPDLVSATDPYPVAMPDKALLVWKPECGIAENSLEDYICLAKEKYGYNGEQALGMLFWHQYDIDEAIHDLPNFTPLPDEWTVEDKVLFEQAFQFHGKNFAKIRQMLPDKTIPALVKYYYSWKKTKNRVSLMDKQARRMRLDDPGTEEGGSGNVSENESDSEETCTNCGQSSSQAMHSSPKGNLCTLCHNHRIKTGMLPKTSGLSKHIVGLTGNGVAGVDLKKQKKPPKGMYLNSQDLMAIASGPPGQGDAILKGLESELCSLKRQVQLNKADISKLKEETTRGIDELRPPEITGKTNPRWSHDEMLLAVQGVRKYGVDFKAIAEVIGNKSEAHVKSFYATQRESYKLDDVLSLWEADNGISPQTNQKPEAERDVPKSEQSATTLRSASPGLRTAATATPPAKVPKLG